MPRRPDAKRTLTLVLLAASLLGPSVARAGESLRCDGALIDVGASSVDLLARCGEPALREATRVESGVVVLEGEPPLITERSVVEPLERWSYNYGPRRFVYHVTLRAGRIVAIDHGGYGYDPAVLSGTAQRAPDCGTAVLRVGDRTLDVLAKCGRPITIDRRTERRAVTVPIAAVTVTATTTYRTYDVEVWTFDPGPGRLTIQVTLEDGVLVSVR